VRQSQVRANDTEAPQQFIDLDIDEPRVGSLVFIAMHLNGRSDESVKDPVVNTCFANLWQQIESLQIPSDSIGEKF
jgi:hypothetical protein